MDNEIIIMGAFLGAGVLSYAVIPGLLVMWDRVLDHMGLRNRRKEVGRGRGRLPLPNS